jgi:hypothetical protein
MKREWLTRSEVLRLTDSLVHKWSDAALAAARRRCRRALRKPNPLLGLLLSSLDGEILNRRKASGCRGIANRGRRR